MAKFKIGDEVIMNDNADKKYRYTTKGFKGIVTEINDKTVVIDDIWVVDIDDCDLYGEPKSDTKKGDDSVNHPSHYTDGKIECIDAIESSMSKEAFKGYCKGNIIKYLWRYEHKGGVESLKKAMWYIDKLTEVIGE